MCSFYLHYYVYKYARILIDVIRPHTHTHSEALVSSEEFRHGAERHRVRSVFLQRCGRLAHHQTGRHQLRRHLGQFKLQELTTERNPKTRRTVNRCKKHRHVKNGGASPDCLPEFVRTVCAPGDDLGSAEPMREQRPENRKLWRTCQQ